MGSPCTDSSNVHPPPAPAQKKGFQIDAKGPDLSPSVTLSSRLMTTPGTAALCNRKENGHYRQMVCVFVCDVCVCECVCMVCVYTGASIGQTTQSREINNGLGFISQGSDTHTCCSLQVLVEIGIHSHTLSHTLSRAVTVLSPGWSLLMTPRG